MRVELLCLFFLGQTLANPIVLFVYTRGYAYRDEKNVYTTENMVPVSFAIIVTEKYLVGTTYPVAMFPMSGTCALVNPRKNFHLKTTNWKHRCYYLKKIYPLPDDSAYNFAVIELREKINFYFGISRAKLLPAAFKYKPEECAVLRALWTRNRVQVANGHIWEKFNFTEQFMDVNFQFAQKKVPSRMAQYIMLNFDVDQWEHFGPMNSGVPLMCKYMVAGIQDTVPAKSRCDEMHLLACLRYTYLVNKEKYKKYGPRFINIQNREVHDFLKMFKLIT